MTDSTRTMTREHRRCPEYSDIFPTGRVDETGQFGDRTQVRWFGQDLSRAPDSGIKATPTKRSGFTSTPVPRYSGKSSSEQYRQVFEAITCSNGWDDVTAALQLLSHLDGDALNVALLNPESQLVLSAVLMKSLSEHYGSPGRLASV